MSFWEVLLNPTFHGQRSKVGVRIKHPLRSLSQSCLKDHLILGGCAKSKLLCACVFSV